MKRMYDPAETPDGPFADSCDRPDTTAAIERLVSRNPSSDVWADALAREINERRRAECMARIQTDAMQLAIDLLVREPDITGFFRVFVKTLVEECDSYACGVWLLDPDKTQSAPDKTQ